MCWILVQVTGGVQTAALRELFDEVTPIDTVPYCDVDGMVVTDAADLPFEDDSFDADRDMEDCSTGRSSFYFSFEDFQVVDSWSISEFRESQAWRLV